MWEVETGLEEDQEFFTLLLQGGQGGAATLCNTTVPTCALVHESQSASSPPPSVCPMQRRQLLTRSVCLCRSDTGLIACGSVCCDVGSACELDANDNLQCVKLCASAAL